MNETKLIWGNFWVKFLAIGAAGTILFAVLSYIWMAEWTQFLFVFFGVVMAFSFIGFQLTRKAWLKSKIGEPIKRHKFKTVFVRLAVAWILWAAAVAMLLSSLLSLEGNLFWLLMAVPATFCMLAAWSLYKAAEKPAVEQGWFTIELVDREGG